VIHGRRAQFVSICIYRRASIDALLLTRFAALSAAHSSFQDEGMELEIARSASGKARAPNDIFRQAHVRCAARADTSGRLWLRVVMRKVCSDAEPGNKASQLPKRAGSRRKATL
jgi:hypothetical protein